MATRKAAKKQTVQRTALKKAGSPAGKKSGSTKTAGKKKAATPAAEAQALQLSSAVVFDGPLFRVFRDEIVEPTGVRCTRDIVRHNGSVVILAVDRSRSKKNPWIVMERQYRYAAGQFLWEVPAGKIDAGEERLAAAQRELAEETGYRARKWRELVTYYASPGFVGESMTVFLAENLFAGETHFDEDERIELRLIKLSDILEMIEKGSIHDGKTLSAVLLYAWRNSRKRRN